MSGYYVLRNGYLVREGSADPSAYTPDGPTEQVFPGSPPPTVKRVPDVPPGYIFDVDAGKPVVVPEVLKLHVRYTRDHLIAKSDWTQLPDIPQAITDKWQPYRQALRDITSQPGFPENIQWPEPPQ